MLMNRKQLFDQLAAGNLETAYKELTRYGSVTLTTDSNREDGAHRARVIRHFENEYHIQMHNGRVCSVSVNGEIFQANRL